MQLYVGLIIAFSLGYLTSQYGLFGSVIEEFVDVTLSSNKVIVLQMVESATALSHFTHTLPLTERNHSRCSRLNIIVYIYFNSVRKDCIH